MDGTGLRPIPGVDPKCVVSGCTPDGAFLYHFFSRASDKAAKVHRVNPAAGKMDFWKEFGGNLQSIGNSVGAAPLRSDRKAYAHVYVQVLSQAYSVRRIR